DADAALQDVAGEGGEGPTRLSEHHAVCPYSHPDHPAHNLVRWMLARSGAARRAGLWMDDAFYGRRPAPAAIEPPAGRSPEVRKISAR
ncbi:MAG: hypothetical protein MUP76_10750, partial [Acidimicrobiia bacterium]|nr:hypothetical protein [Acidimicrobiia bacterium]